MRLVLFLAVWGWGVVRGEVDAAGHVCGEQFVTWPQSQLETGLSAGCSAFYLLTGGGASGLAFTPLPGADAHLGHTWNRGRAWYPGDVCLCPCILAQLGTAGSLLGEWGGAGLGSDPQCEMLWWALVTGLSLLPPSSPPSPLYPPEKTSALHAALLPTHCASWQTHNLTFLGLI